MKFEKMSVQETEKLVRQIVTKGKFQDLLLGIEELEVGESFSITLENKNEVTSLRSAFNAYMKDSNVLATIHTKDTRAIIVRVARIPGEYNNPPANSNGISHETTDEVEEDEETTVTNDSVRNASVEPKRKRVYRRKGYTDDENVIIRIINKK